ncbi:MAG TPA: hypothetical protein VMB74_03080 [Streptosporangiaceae bacterium]|nr:hypothetical protein [Streptosporangiaceae bacterium]
MGAGELSASQVEGKRSPTRREHVKIHLAAVGGSLPDLVEALALGDQLAELPGGVLVLCDEGRLQLWEASELLTGVHYQHCSHGAPDSDH